MQRNSPALIARRPVMSSSMPSAFICATVVVSLVAFAVQGNSALLGVFLLASGILLIGACHTLTRDWLSPPVLFTVVWTATLFLASLGVDFRSIYYVFNVPILAKTWFAFIAAIFFYLGGNCVGFMLCGRVSGATRGYDRRRLRVIVRVTFGLGLMGYVVCFLAAGQVPVLSMDVNAVRSEFRLPVFGMLFVMFILTTALASYELGRSGLGKGNRELLLLASLSIIMMLSTTQRSDSFQAFVISAVAYLVAARSRPQTARRKGRRGARWTLPLAAGAVLLAAFLYVGGVRSDGEKGVYANDIVDIENPLVAHLYIYSYAPSIKNFQWAVDQETERCQGLLMGRTPLWAMGRLHLIPQDVDFGGVNTATWLWYYYRDFGYLGICLVPFGLGVLSSIIYIRSTRGNSILATISYGLVVSCLVWTGGTERFFEPVTMVCWAYLVVVEYSCRRSTRTQGTARTRAAAVGKQGVALRETSGTGKGEPARRRAG